MLHTYNEQVERVAVEGIPLEAVENDPALISWSRGLRGRLKSGRRIDLEDKIYPSMYRPFTKQFAYIDRSVNEFVGQIASMFPTPHHTNYGVYLNGINSSASFCCQMIDTVPCFDLYGKGGQFFPRWIYEKAETPEGQFNLITHRDDVDEHGYRRIDNITNEVLADYQSFYESAVTKDDIFYYVYGLLHSFEYRSMYAADLTKMLPRIPKVASATDFRTFVDTGQQLATLHLGYETAEPYPLTEVVKKDAPTDVTELYRVTKMKYGPSRDESKLIYNPWITLERIPPEAHKYMLGSRSGIDWVIDRYQIKVDKKSGIINDANDWATEHAEPRYILDLIKRVITVSVCTVGLVSKLPKLEIVNH